MKTSARVTNSTLAAVVLGLAITSPVHAIPVIANGGFEAGLTSWTKSDQLGSEGTFFSQSGTAARRSTGQPPTHMACRQCRQVEASAAPAPAGMEAAFRAL